MEFALNYSPQAVDLLAQGRIALDRFKCPAWDDVIAAAQETRPPYVHLPLRVGTGIGDAIDTEKKQPADWRRMESLLAQTGTPYVNLHLLPLVSDFPDLPEATDDPIHVERMLEAALRDVEAVVRRFGADKVIVESDYYHEGHYFRASCQPDFIRRVIEAAGCGFLLDISHARLAARSLDMETHAYFDGLPLDRIREVHLTGIQYFDERWAARLRGAGIAPEVIADFAGRWIDHLPITEDDWTFFEWAFAQLRRRRVGAPLDRFAGIRRRRWGVGGADRPRRAGGAGAAPHRHAVRSLKR